MSKTVNKVLFYRLVLFVSLSTIFLVYYYYSGSQCDKPLKIWSLKSLSEFNISQRPQLFLKLGDLSRRESWPKLPLPYGVSGSEKLLTKVLTALVSHNDSTNIAKTCVVVGNSFSLKNRSLGSIINSFDAVIRLNNAPVRGYEDDVGNKTTMRLFYPESAVADPRLHNELGTLMVLVPFKPQDLHWLKAILYNEKMVNEGFWRRPPQTWLGNTSKIRVLDPYFQLHTAKLLLRIPVNSTTHVFPSTGLLAVFVALNHCSVVHIAGFGYPDTKDQKQMIHYFGYDTMKAMKKTVHDLQREAEAFKHLEELGSILRLHQ